jgi:hypothetical protein
MEAPAVVDLSARLVPLTIRHAEVDLFWSVLAVLEDWTTPAYHDDVGTPMETKRFRVRVTGPLPGRPAQVGEFGMIVRRYGDRDGWGICPEPEAPGRLSARAVRLSRTVSANPLLRWKGRESSRDYCSIFPDARPTS